MQISEVEQFVRRNLVAARPGRQCIDGRYAPAGEDSGRLARPGADAGYVGVLLGLKNLGYLKLSVREIADHVVAALRAQEETFYFHSDEAAEKSVDPSSIGCGHLAGMARPETASLYRVHPEDAQEAVRYLRELAHQGQAKMTVLQGSHAESGVLLVQGDSLTVNQRDDSLMFFKQDEDRERAFRARLVQQLTSSGLDLSAFEEVDEAQTQATLQLLASHLPVFRVDPAGGVTPHE